MNKKSLSSYFFNSIVLLIILLFLILNYSNYQLKEALEIEFLIVQILAIVFGGIWAWNKFGWEKKAENIISLKAALMKYEWNYRLMAAEYRKNNSFLEYAASMVIPYGELQKEIKLSLYIPKELRDKILNTIFLPIFLKNKNVVDNEWKEFGEEIKKIFEELDNLV